MIKEGNLDMATYETLMKGGKRGQPIVPGIPRGDVPELGPALPLPPVGPRRK